MINLRRSRSDCNFYTSVCWYSPFVSCFVNKSYDKVNICRYLHLKTEPDLCFEGVGYLVMILIEFLHS